MTAIKPGAFQTPNKANLNRTFHVWVKTTAGDGWYKCVLCGGLSRKPNDEVECERYEKLTDTERALCPQ